ncbi:MAG TPA: mechanosensitive ion channel family protein [Bacteroidales bacterium]|nr:mechanosensitive ion channel family protein [Bacteroidales bacterium]HNZ42679.1 mechanosensitive ion channel family protein [Bacteroidales bacterium]HOH84571.1 mechanosensitive ion channel family protein [Bacteroidales bacterium]HPB25465.1 mechanosensitive ion channel family protein [Bacteroidales bacterium]HPI29594.1 mechanosensitive ion channel family protein [Bacteroidales bacterium]
MKEKFYEWIEKLIPWLLNHGIKILFISLAMFILYKLVGRAIKKIIRLSVKADKDSSPEAQKKRELTLLRIFNWVSRVLFFLLGGLMILQEAGIPVGPLLAGAGIVGIAVGFGGQYLIRDLLSGFFIIFENQYRIGDVVSFDKTSGVVEDISLRLTTLRDMDGTVHHVPHGEIKIVSNLSKDYARINMDIGVAYNTSFDHVIKVINEVGYELSNDPQWKELIINPPQFLRVAEFAESAIIIKILGETQPMKQWEVSGELRKRLKIAFDKEGIEIPFPQRVMHQAV